MRAGIALGAYGAIRKGDVVSLTWAKVQGGVIEAKQEKTDDPIWLPIAAPLKAILDETPKTATSIVTTGRGTPFTYSGFDTAFGRLRDRLEASGAIGPDITFHGLRHTAATNLADAGCDDRDIAAVTGHKSVEMVRRYTRRANQRRRATAAIARLENHPRHEED